MAETSIEWAHFTFNPWLGCDKVSPGCKNCYAAAWAKQRGRPELWQGVRNVTKPDYWKQLGRWNWEAALAGEYSRVFAGSLCDVFEDRPDLDEPRQRLMGEIAKQRCLIFMLLTKRPENALTFLGDWVAGGGSLPANLRVGCTIEDAERARLRMPIMRAIAGFVPTFLSVEPMLSAIDWAPGDLAHKPWVICGGESGAGARPMDPAWPRKLRDDCAAAGTTFFFKQWGQHNADLVRLKSKHDAGRLLDGVLYDAVPSEFKGVPPHAS
jgi:protein gp37